MFEQQELYFQLDNEIIYKELFVIDSLTGFLKVHLSKRRRLMVLDDKVLFMK
jgi:hypothetical protein